MIGKEETKSFYFVLPPPMPLLPQFNVIKFLELITGIPETQLCLHQNLQDQVQSREINPS